MAYYTVPRYAQTFIQTTPLYPQQSQIVYPGNVITSPTVIASGPTVIAPGTVITPGYVRPKTYITPGGHVRPGTVITPGYVKPQVVVAGGGVIQSSVAVPTGNTVVLQNPQPTVVVHQYQSGSGASNLARSVGGAMAVAAQSNVVQEAAKSFVDEMDKHAKSPLLDCFMMGSGIQLRSKQGGGMLRVKQDGSLDCKGNLGNDYNAHFLVVEKYNNSIVLRNGENNAYHLTIYDGLPTTTMANAYFQIHETFDHYVTLRHQQTGQYIGVDNDGNMLPSQFVSATSNEAKFEVHLAYSPYGYRYESSHY